MSSNLTPQDPFTFRHTNVSNPSIIYSRPSQQSIVASEDYYSLSGSSASSTRSAHNHKNGQSQQTITQFQTPPSHHQTPQRSTPQLPSQSREGGVSNSSREQFPQQQNQPQSQQENNITQLLSAGPSRPPEVARHVQHVAFEQESEDPEQGRKTPMRGEGKRRSSTTDNQSTPLLGVNRTGSMSASNRTGNNGMRGQQPQDGRGSYNQPGRAWARSSVAAEMDRDVDTPTQAVDDTQYIHFALDQLTRDEEVRGSRTYGLPPSLPYQPAPKTPAKPQPHRQAQTEQWPQKQRRVDEEDIVEASPPRSSKKRLVPPALPPPPEDFKEGPNVFIPMSNINARQPQLDFLPGILRTSALLVYLTLLFLYLFCLIFTASWSRANTGLWDYGSFGDGRYFVFQFLPTMLGMVILMWLFQIEIAVYRIAPFIAMASPLPHARSVGAHLPLQPHGYILPYLGHLKAGQPVVGAFLLVAWLQLFTIPLLGSSFNVFYLGSPSSGHWRWIATQGVIWVVIALYIFLFIALILLHLWLRRATTGLKWDPRSLADFVVLLERSNALDPQDPSGQLGYWRTTKRPNEIMHTFGIADKPARSYVMENGQIREKPNEPVARRYSDPDMDLEAGQPRASKDAILPSSDVEFSPSEHKNGPLPWFLWPSFALLWPIVAIVLLLAFLIVSYLPSTHLRAGFLPDLPVPVNSMGFSGANFFYSFIPSLLATLCFLFWLSIDMAYRRLQPLASLNSPSGSIAERTLLTTYPSDLPILATLSAVANTHYRLAFHTFISIIAATLPILAGGVFFAQFDIATQRTLMTANMTAFYALTVFITLYALAYLTIFPPSSLRSLPHKVGYTSFSDLRSLVTHSKLIHDVPFRAPASHTDLVTRLLSPFPGIYLSRQQQQYKKGSASGEKLFSPSSTTALNASKLSLADSVRGFGRARPAPLGGEVADWNALPVYAFGRHVGRDGKEFVGLDRVRS